MKKTITIFSTIFVLALLGHFTYKYWDKIFPAEAEVSLEYSVSLVSEDENKGTVKKLSVEKFKKDTVITLVAHPNEGYTFAGFWDNSNLISDRWSHDYTVSKDVKIVAKFAEEKDAEPGPSAIVQFALEATEGGTVERLAATEGFDQQISATSNSGYTFLGWYGGKTDTLISAENPFNFKYTEIKDDALISTETNDNETISTYKIIGKFQAIENEPSIEYDFSVIPENMDFIVDEDNHTAIIARYTGNQDVLVLPKTCSFNIEEEEVQFETLEELRAYFEPKAAELPLATVGLSLVKIRDAGGEIVFEGDMGVVADQLENEGVSTFPLFYIDKTYTAIVGNDYVISEIGDHAFEPAYYSCTYEKVVIPSTITSIGQNAFSSSTLNEVIFENRESTLVLGHGVFSDTKFLTSISFSFPVEFGTYCFNASSSNYLSLTDVYFYNITSVPVMDYTAFTTWNSNVKKWVSYPLTIHVPANLVAAFQASNWGQFTIIANEV